jgi:hypothetical protein
MSMSMVSAEILLTPDLTLDSHNPYAKIALNPSTLPPGGRGSALWWMLHPVKNTEKRYVVRVRITSPDADTSMCEALVIIPPLVGSFHFGIDSSGALVICNGDSVLLRAPTGQASYAWNTGATTREIAVRTGGSYWCTTVATDGRIGISDTVKVTVRPVSHPNVTVIGSIPFCEGDTITLDAGGGIITNVRWNTGAQGRTLRVSEAGAYYADVTNTYGCVGRTDTVHVTLLPVVRPVITRSGDVLTTDKAVTYQWLHNGTPLHSETNQFLIAREVGRYQVRITDANGCTGLSDPFDVSVLGLDTAPAPGSCAISVHPSPATDAVTLQISGSIDEAADVYLVDVLGRAVRITSLQRGHVSFRQVIPLRDAAPGSYHIVMLSGARTQTHRFLKL